MRLLFTSLFFLAFLSTSFCQKAVDQRDVFAINQEVDYELSFSRVITEINQPEIADPIIVKSLSNYTPGNHSLNATTKEAPSPSVKRIVGPEIVRNFFFSGMATNFSSVSKQINFKQIAVQVSVGSGFKYSVEKGLTIFVQPLYQRNGVIYYSKSETKDRLFNAGIRAGIGWHIL